jgi:plasmid stabilization system protein ParE
VTWRRTALRSLASLLRFLKTNGFGDPEARRKQIQAAVESLRHSPLRCAVVGVRGRLTFRRLIMDGRYYVYYVYTAPHGMSSGGTLSIRAVKHAASQNPFLDVREKLARDQLVGALSTRVSAELVTTA